MLIPNELTAVIDIYIEFKENFTFLDVKDIYTKLLTKSEVYKDPVSDDVLKSMIMKIFESGNMPGYCMIAQPHVGEEGPNFILEFRPSNPMNLQTLIATKISSDYEDVVCKIDPYYKDFLEYLSEKSEIDKDVIIGSLLTKSLALIMDQLK